MVFLLGFITITTSELNGNPALNGMGIEHVQGSTEGKSTIWNSIFFTIRNSNDSLKLGLLIRCMIR